MVGQTIRYKAPPDLLILKIILPEAMQGQTLATRIQQVSHFIDDEDTNAGRARPRIESTRVDPMLARRAEGGAEN